MKTRFLMFLLWLVPIPLLAAGLGNPGAGAALKGASAPYVPDAPVITDAVQAESEGDVSWTHPAQGTPALADSYTIQKRINGGTWADWETGLTPDQAVWIEAHGGGQGDLIEFRMKATKGATDSAWSNGAGFEVN